jgi:hypothetical protein
MENMESVERINGRAATQIRIRKPAHHNVDIKDSDEIKMWCRRLGVTPFQLCSVVDRVGNEVVSVQNALRAR